jgi:hypothetical protein
LSFVKTKSSTSAWRLSTSSTKKSLEPLDPAGDLSGLADVASSHVWRGKPRPKIIPTRPKCPIRPKCRVRLGQRARQFRKGDKTLPRPRARAAEQHMRAAPRDRVAAGMGFALAMPTPRSLASSPKPFLAASLNWLRSSPVRSGRAVPRTFFKEKGNSVRNCSGTRSG